MKRLAAINDAIEKAIQYRRTVYVHRWENSTGRNKLHGYRFDTPIEQADPINSTAQKTIAIVFPDGSLFVRETSKDPISSLRHSARNSEGR